jgi:uncharacterized protein YeaO (DUF488 family)
MIKVRRTYEPAARGDGKRFLVDRLWPRGVTKEVLQLEAWQPILEAAHRGSVTLLYGARDVEHNNAVALKEYLEKQTL